MRIHFCTYSTLSKSKNPGTARAVCVDGVHGSECCRFHLFDRSWRCSSTGSPLSQETFQELCHPSRDCWSFDVCTTVKPSSEPSRKISVDRKSWQMTINLQVLLTLYDAGRHSRATLCKERQGIPYIPHQPPYFAKFLRSHFNSHESHALCGAR